MAFVKLYLWTQFEKKTFQNIKLYYADAWKGIGIIFLNTLQCLIFVRPAQGTYFLVPQKIIIWAISWDNGLFVIRKVILQTRMRSHPVVLDVWCLIEPFVYFHTTCMRTAKALARLRGCAGSPECSLVAYVISTIISYAGSFLFCLSVKHLSAKVIQICTLKYTKIWVPCGRQW